MPESTYFNLLTVPKIYSQYPENRKFKLQVSPEKMFDNTKFCTIFSYCLRTSRNFEKKWLWKRAPIVKPNLGPMSFVPLPWPLTHLWRKILKDFVVSNNTEIEFFRLRKFCNIFLKNFMTRTCCICMTKDLTILSNFLIRNVTNMEWLKCFLLSVTWMPHDQL